MRSCRLCTTGRGQGKGTRIGGGFALAVGLELVEPRGDARETAVGAESDTGTTIGAEGDTATTIGAGGATGITIGAGDGTGTTAGAGSGIGTTAVQGVALRRCF